MKKVYSENMEIPEEILENFMDAFQIPQLAKPYLETIFTKQEIYFCASMKKSTFSKTDIAEILGDEADRFQKSAYHRGIISYVDQQQELFCLANFYERMDIMAISEQETYRSIPEEGQKVISDWAFERYYQGLDPDLTVRPTVDEILPLEEVLEFIEQRKDKPVYLNYCDCKSLNGQCKKPSDTCITYKDGINTYAHRGHSRRITPEEAKEVIKRADKAGLVHTVNPTGICNCCNDCCYLFRSQKKRNSAGFWPKTEHIISYDAEKCIQCGLCVKRCMFQVFSKKDKKIEVNTKGCVGCGVCKTSCPAGALRLVTR